ncbi:ubiquinol-cytochrome c reductase iron-sulfur subunit [Chloroflexota bacterium]
MSENKVSRRDFMKIAWGAAGALAATELGLVGLRFLSPRTIEGEFGGIFNLGNHEQYPPGSVTPVEVGRFYLVRLEDGGFLTIYRRCTHLGCAVPYDQGSGQFVCPCHGSAFTVDGDVLTPPAPRPLDLFALSINADGEIAVDTGTTIERDHPDPKYIVYA